MISEERQTWNTLYIWKCLGVSSLPLQVMVQLICTFGNNPRSLVKTMAFKHTWLTEEIGYQWTLKLKKLLKELWGGSFDELLGHITNLFKKRYVLGTWLGANECVVATLQVLANSRELNANARKNLCSIYNTYKHHFIKWNYGQITLNMWIHHLAFRSLS